jgi:hypothetical protein
MWSLLLTLQAAPAVAPSPPPARWVLVYAGANRAGITTYTVSHFTRLLAHVDSAGRPAYWQCTGAIFLNLHAASGRVFTTWIGGVPANGADWAEYADSLFAPGGVLSRLDSAVALASAMLGPPPDPIRVSIMIPYPELNAGMLRFEGKQYNLRTADGRVGAASAYVADVERGFRGAGHARLRLDGFYWLFETMPSSDAGVVRRIAREVHARGLRLLWIPYYDAQGWERWDELGFDEAWLQPNYFFNRDVPPSRLDSAAARAVRRGMGLEIEFDGRLLATPGFGDRLDPYLEVLRRYPQLARRSIAVYDGGGALLALSRSPLPAHRLRYEQLGQALRRSGP